MSTTEIGNKTDPLIGNMFAIELDNGLKGFFTEAGGLGIEISVEKISYSQNDGKVRSMNRPGTADYQDITLKRTLTKDKTFWDWFKAVADGKIRENRTNGAIVCYDSEDKRVASWTFMEAWPSKWSASDLDASSNTLMIETVTLTIEMLKREA